jgi:predicted PurR-regulated permease PerM
MHGHTCTIRKRPYAARMAGRARAGSSAPARARATKPKVSPEPDEPVAPATHPIPYRLILAVIWLAIGSGLTLLVLYFLRTLLFHLVVAAFLALVLTRPVTVLQRKIGRGKAIALVLSATFVAAVGIGTLIAAPLTAEAVKFAGNAPTVIQDAAKGKGAIGRLARRFHLEEQLKKAGPGLSNTLGRLSGEVLNFGRRIASAAFTAAIVVILAIFMLVEGPRSIDWALRTMPERHQPAARRVGRAVLKVVSGYTIGVLLLAFMNGAVAGVAMTVTHTQFVLPLAVWAAMIDILPIVGGLLSMIPAGLFGFVHSVPAGITVLVAILVYQQIKNHLLYPVIVGRAVQLNSLLVLVAVLAGAELAHVAGAVLAIPVAGAIQVVATEVVAWRRETRAAAEAQPA